MRRTGPWLAALLGAAVLVPSAAQAQIASAIPFQGHLADERGRPIEGPQAFVVGFYAGDEATEALYEETTDAELVDGRFTLYVGLGGDAPLDLAIFQSEVWVEITVVGPPEETFDRFPLGVVPQAAAAAFALECGMLGGRGPDAFAPASHTHSFSELVDVPPAVVEELYSVGPGLALSEENELSVSAGAGLLYSESGDLDVDLDAVQGRIDNNCPPGQAIRQVGRQGGVACQPTDYAGVDGIVVDSGDREIGIGADAVDVDRLSWGVPLQLEFMPITPRDDCGSGSQPGFGRPYGSTSDRDEVYVGVLRYDESGSDNGLRHDYRRARLTAACSNLIIEVVDSCDDRAEPIATIDCDRSDLPRSSASAEFAPRTGNWYLRVRSPGGTGRWAHPSVAVY